MAQGRSFFDDVKKELDCSVCQEQFSSTKEPKILKCLHTFCRSCLEAWLARQREGKLSCPTCRQITECPKNDINRLPSNLFYKQLVDIVDAYSGGGQDDSPQCGNCEEKNYLKFYCSRCNCFLCGDCAGAHLKGKLFRGHQVKEIRNFQSSDVQDYARRANVCKKHDDEVRFFCVNCQICICRDCALLGHQDHKRISIDEGLEINKSEIEAKMRKVQTNGSSLRTHRETLEKRRQKLSSDIDVATREVKRVAAFWVLLIRKHEESVLQQLLKQNEALQDSFAAQTSCLDGKLTEIESTVAFCEEVLLRKNLQEILNVKAIIEERLQDLSLSSLENIPKEDYSRVKYVSNDFSFTPGKVITSNTEPSLSVAKGKGITEGIVGHDCSFTVITKDSAGKDTYSEIDEVQVAITSVLPQRDVTEPVNMTLKDGRYTFSYRPTTPGEFTVSIKVAGTPIMGSPFTLRVKSKLRPVKKIIRNSWNTLEHSSDPRKLKKENWRQKIIEHEAINSLTTEQLHRIHTLELRYGVEVNVEKQVYRIVLGGQAEDVLQVFGEIHEILHEVKKNEHERSHAEILSKDVQWKYREFNEKFEEYESEVNAQIELAYQQKKTKVMIMQDDEKYHIDFDAMTENDEDGNTNEVRRIDLRKDVEFPNYWTPQPADANGREETLHLFELDPSKDTLEYKKVSDLFRKSCAQNIIKIERVQNPRLYETYAVNKQKMDKEKAQGSNEMLLFHGTKGPKCQLINHKGFNRSFCGENAALYGNGVYFALQAAYSARSTYSPADTNGHRHMYLARVVVGEYTVGKQGILTPPPKRTNDLTDTYDTLVDNVSNPSIYVVFYDWQCYPEYLITFQ